MSMAIEEGRARLNLEEVQELRAYVRRGSPVLLSASAAEAVLDTIEREMFRPLREKWLADMSRHATMALDELQTAHARIAELETQVRVLEDKVSYSDELLSEWSGSYPRKDVAP